MIIFIEQVNLNTVIYSLVIIFIFLMFKNVITNIIIKLIKKISDKYKLKGITLIVESIEEPLKRFFTYTGIYFALSILPFIPTISLFLNRVYRACIIISVTQGLLNIISAYSYLLNEGYYSKDKKIQIPNTVFPLLFKIVKVLIIVIAVVAVAVEFNFKQLNSIIAGLGIGGAALALASQDLIKNFFGGFIVLTDKSFNIGDWIKVDSSEGTVEELGLRSTKIRTIDKELVIVPNAKFTDREVINYTMRKNRRASFTIGATYDTSSEKLLTVIDRIKEMLDSHPMVKEDSSIVKFDGFGDSSLNIAIQYLTNTSQYVEFLDIKNDINFNIMNICEEVGISFALPSMSVYMEKN